MAEKSHTPSRRAMLAGLAAAPVAGPPAVVNAAGLNEISPELVAAFAEHARADAAIKALPENEDIPDDLGAVEWEAVERITLFPCRSTADFLAKLRFLTVYEKDAILGDPFDIAMHGPIYIALEAHFFSEGRS
jgi:hypothetical protein